MKGKKKEDFDLSTLPKLNIVVSSLIFNSKNPERRFKLLENLFKTQDKTLKLLTREQIIEFAKENKIYIDPEDGKKPGPKDPPIEKREITADELAKAAVGLINDRSIPFRKDKKVIVDKIQELQKQKDEAIAYWTHQSIPSQDHKKKPPPEKKKEPPHPNEIIVPAIDENETEMVVILYNYPLSSNEYISLEKEQLVINNVHYVKDIDEYVEAPKIEVVLDKNAKKPPPVKEVKPSNEVLQMQRNFAVHPTYSNTETVYEELQSAKWKSRKLSSMRFCLFDKAEFTYKVFDDIKKDSIVLFQEKISQKLKDLGRYYLFYLKWASSGQFQKLIANESEVKVYTPSSINHLHGESSLELKDFDHESLGTIFFSFCEDLIKKLRHEGSITKCNMLIYDNNGMDDLFNTLEKQVEYEFGRLEASPGEKDFNKTREKDNENTNIQDIHSTVQFVNHSVPNVNITSYPSHLNLEIEKEKYEIEQEMLRSNALSSPFKLVIGENDDIMKATLENKIDNQLIYQREKDMNVFLGIPGMPKQKHFSRREENHRRGVKSELHAFLPNNISIPIYEKYEILSRFEEILKKEIPEQSFDFGDRIYEENMNKDILSQVINKIQMHDIESKAVYNERSNSTCLLFYYRCPNGRVYRKTKKYPYLSKPEFENWMKYFRPTFKEPEVKHEITNISSANAIPLKLVNDKKEADRKIFTPPRNKNVTSKPVSPSQDPMRKTGTFEVLFKQPDQLLYEADDFNIGEVKEKIKYMFPCDDAVFIKKIIETGIWTSFSSYVIKDNLVFGIRKNSNNVTEFWCRFENDVLLTVNYLGDYDSVFSSSEDPRYETKYGSYVNFSFINGLNVQILPNGEICQKIYTPKEDESISIPNEDGFIMSSCNTNYEKYRIITSKASVVRYLPMETHIMYSNGNSCSIINGLATNINNKGLRIARNVKDNTLQERDPISVYAYADPESNTKTIVREDQVIVIKYPDTSTLAIHTDETRIYAYPTLNEIKRYCIEHDNYATVEITYDAVKKRTKSTIAAGSSEALVGSDDLMARSYDGRMSKITLPDKTLVYTYKEKKATEEFEKCTFNTVTIVYRVDGTVLRIQQDGDIVIITSQERMNFNAKGSNADFFNNKDIDYLFELNCKAEERKGGVYSANLKKSKIWTRDAENNIFELHSDGVAKCKIQGTTIAEMNEKTIDEIRPNSPRYDTTSYVDPDTRFCEPPKNFFPPRLFVVENDHTGYELLTEKQVNNFIINKAKDTLHVKSNIKKIDNDFTSHDWITKHITIKEQIRETHMLNEIKIPQKQEKLKQTPVNPNYPQKEVYTYRHLIESQPFLPDFRQQIASAKQSRKEWLEEKESQIKFGKFNYEIHAKGMKENIAVQRRILKEK